MTAEAIYRAEGDTIDFTPVAAISAGEVIQLPDGRAAFAPSAISAGVKGAVCVRGIAQIPKTANIVLLDGQEAFWDHSANSGTYWHANDRDFFIGTVVGDTLAADTTMEVVLNVRPSYIIDINRDPFATLPVFTAGVLVNRRSGSRHALGFSATAEAQKLDLLSLRSFPKGSKWIFEAMIAVMVDCDADVGDLVVGVANATHASDADSITESVFIKLNLTGADLKIYAESDDTTASEVAATDTTKVFVVGTQFHVMIDGRNEQDCQIYINGVLVLPSSVFTLAGATGPLKALFHFEKSSNDSLGEAAVDMLRVRIMEQSGGVSG